MQVFFLVGFVAFAAALNERIIGGNNVVSGSYPSITWQARLYISDPLGGRAPFVCGAAILGPQHLVTIAHCLQSLDAKSFRALPKNVVVSVGLLPAPVVAGGQSIWIHPSFATNTAAANVIDLAVIQLNTTLSLTNTTITAIPLSAIGQNITVGQSLIVSGWGWTDETAKTFPSTLQWVALPYTDTATCTAAGVAQQGSSFVLPSSAFCAGGLVGKDSCYYDGGSPIVLDLGNTTFVAVGLVLSGTKLTTPSCGVAGQYGTYTDLRQAAVQSFIQAAVAGNSAAAGTQPWNGATHIAAPLAVVAAIIAALMTL